ncbi:MAG: single-stranded DNA-binding protein [Actinobacteria bacterium]|nr:single-stranded DNA-binding protein [Actinomycetota bacterium]
MGKGRKDAVVDGERVNQIYLRGRLAAPPLVRELPSGDVLAAFRLTVDREPASRVRVDSIDCIAIRPRVRQRLSKATAGELLEVEGSLRRRFWRSPTGPASRYAVEVESLRRCRP